MTDNAAILKKDQRPPRFELRNSFVVALTRRFAPSDRLPTPRQLYEIFWRVFNATNFGIYTSGPSRSDLWESTRWDPKDLNLMAHIILHGSDKRARELGYSEKADVKPGVEGFLYCEKKILSEAGTDPRKAIAELTLLSRMRNAAELQQFLLPPPDVSQVTREHLRKAASKENHTSLSKYI